MTKRMNLSFGQGSVDVILDLVTGWVEKYSGSTDNLHQRLGGKQYYESRSGLSGAGWVTARPTLVHLGGYRVDTFPLGLEIKKEFKPHVGAYEVYVPYAYRGGEASEWPVVLRASDGTLTFCDVEQVADFLRGQQQTTPREYKTTYLKETSSGESQLVTTITEVIRWHGKRGWANAHRIVEHLHREQVAFVYPEGWATEGDGEFWKRLGFRRLPDGLYKIVRGVCRYMIDEWDNIAEIQKWVPANVQLITPNLYIQERDGEYVAVARHEHSGQWYDFELYLEPQRAFRLFAGDREEITNLERELEAGTHNKHVRALADAEQLEEASRETLARDEKFRALLEEHAKVELSVADSLAAGNCHPGTDDFVRRFFPGRATATVKELSRFAAAWGVRRTLEHKLLEMRRAPGEALLASLALDTPRGEADDLTKITGITPRMAQSLGDRGIYHYWQIAAFEGGDITALDELLNVKGSIERDRWAEQAKALTA